MDNEKKEAMLMDFIERMQEKQRGMYVEVKAAAVIAESNALVALVNLGKY